METWTSQDKTIEARLGAYWDCFPEECPSEVSEAPPSPTHLITDPPYSSATHDAWDGNAGEDEEAAKKNAEWAAARGLKPLRAARKALPYASWDHEDARWFVGFWNLRITGWMVVLTDDVLAPTFKQAMRDVGRCTFPILPLYIPYSRIRISGDGPSNWTCSIVVSRPRTETYRKWGTLPGGYSGPTEDMRIVGGKPLWAMRAMVRDYSRRGDRVIDPCCGDGTTALAASIEGRFGITSELDPSTFKKAVQRLARPRDIDMFAGTSVSAPTPRDDTDTLITAAYQRGLDEGRRQAAEYFSAAIDSFPTVEAEA